MKERILWVVALCCALSLAAASAEGQERRVRAKTRLNLRSCPTCAPVGTLEAGTEMQVIGASAGDWLQVRVMPEGETGWVSSRYVADLPPPVDPALAEQQRLLHDRFVTAFIWLGIAGFVLSAIAWAKSRKREQMSAFAALLFDPKIVMSWFVLLESGLLALLLMTSSWVDLTRAVQLQEYLKMAAPFGYSGWALFWGFAPFRRTVRKAVPWLITWFSMGAFALLLLPFLIALAFLYSFFGGGLIHFALHCWKVVTAPSPAVQAPSATATATGGEEKKEQKRTDSVREEPVREARPLGNTLQLEHPEW